MIECTERGLRGDVTLAAGDLPQASGFAGIGATMRIEDVLKELKHELTIVLVTNLVQQAWRLADRTAFFLGGRCIEVGQTEAMFSGNVQDPRTTDYLEGRFG